jgi:hypothetical protein
MARNDEINSEKIYCPSCGAQNPDGSKYCQQCGTALPSELIQNLGKNSANGLKKPTPKSKPVFKKHQFGRGEIIGISILIIAIIGIMVYLSVPSGSNDITVPSNMTTNYISFTNASFAGVSFSYPSNWSAILIDNQNHIFYVLINNYSSTNIKGSPINVSGNGTSNTVQGNIGINDTIIVIDSNKNEVSNLSNLNKNNYNYVFIDYLGIYNGTLDNMNLSYFTNSENLTKSVFRQNGLNLLEVNYIDTTDNYNTTIFFIQNPTDKRLYGAYCHILPNNTENLTQDFDEILGTFKIQ